MSTTTERDFETKVDEWLGAKLNTIAYHHHLFTSNSEVETMDRATTGIKAAQDFIDREIAFGYKLTRGSSAQARIDLLKEAHCILLEKVIYPSGLFSKEEKLKLLDFWSRQFVSPFAVSFLNKLFELTNINLHPFPDIFDVKEGKEIEAIIFFQRHLLETKQI